MAYRKYYKSKKAAKKYRRRKAKTTYPDRHNWKLEAGANVIYNNGSSSTVASGGSVAISNKVVQRTNFSQFGGAFYFSLDKCLGTAAYLSANFDRYKINAIKVRVIPENNFSNVAGSGTLATMKVCYDYDDNTIPFVGDIEVRRGRTYRLDKPFTISLTPKVNNVVFAGAAGSATAPMKAPWLNMSSLTVPHYGIKFMIRDWYCTTSSPPNDLQLRFQITYMISVKEQIAVNRGPSLVESIDGETQILTDSSGNVEIVSLYNPAERE